MNNKLPPRQSLFGNILDYCLKTIKIVITNGAILVAGAGILGNIWVYLISQINATQIAAREDLSTYASYGKLLEKYRNDIEPAIGNFLRNKQYLSLDKNPRNINTDGTFKDPDEYNIRCKNLLQTKTSTYSGFELFNLKEYEDYRVVHNFYETLGFSLRNKLINFETVFNMFIYPAYWEQGEMWASVDPFYELELCLRENWFGEGRPLKDFSDNFLQLGYNYHYRRLLSQVKTLGCDTKKNQNIPDDCKRLSKMVKEIKDEQRNTQKKAWKALYPDLCSNVWTLGGRLQNECRT
jgi:hypothetical protein